MSEGKPVYLTKNGYGSMVVMSLDHYEQLISSIEYRLDEADRQAAQTDERISHEEMFALLRKFVNEL